MTVDYELGASDFVAFSRERRNFGGDSLSRLYYYGILPALGVGLAVVVESFTIAAIFTVLFIASVWFINARTRRLLYSEENLLFSTRRWSATLAQDGLRIASDAAEILYRWSAVRQVVHGTRYIRFEFSPIQHLHIPIRAFRNEEQTQEFVKIAESFVKGTKV